MVRDIAYDSEIYSQNLGSKVEYFELRVCLFWWYEEIIYKVDIGQGYALRIMENRHQEGNYLKKTAVKLIMVQGVEK